MRLKNLITKIAVFIIIAVSASRVFADDIKVYVNDNRVDFDVNPIIENGRTLVPLRAIFVALGAVVEWNEDTNTAVATLNGDTVRIAIGSNVLYKNDTAVELDVPAQIVEERTLVPLRAVSESFDAKVDWDEATGSIAIITEEPDAADNILLNEEDINKLIEAKDEIRYNFEQSSMPKELFENRDTIYAMLENEGSFGEFVYNQWNMTATAYAFLVATASETTYEMNSGDVLGLFAGSLKAAGLDVNSVLEGVTCTQTENGTGIGVIKFKNADNMVDCKYIGIAASENGAPRYFTAENDPFYTDAWCFCEVTEEGRGTFNMFKKLNNSEEEVKTFVELVAATYEN